MKGSCNKLHWAVSPQVILANAHRCVHKLLHSSTTAQLAVEFVTYECQTWRLACCATMPPVWTTLTFNCFVVEHDVCIAGTRFFSSTYFFRSALTRLFSLMPIWFVRFLLLYNFFAFLSCPFGCSFWEFIRQMKMLLLVFCDNNRQWKNANEFWSPVTVRYNSSQRLHTATKENEVRTRSLDPYLDSESGPVSGLWIRVTSKI